VCRGAHERQAVDPTRIPTNLRELVTEPCFDAAIFAGSPFGKMLFEDQAYRWVVRTPTRNHCGDTDEAITQGIGRLAVVFQQAMGNDQVEPVSTGPTSHRGTYAPGAAEWKRWFDRWRLAEAHPATRRCPAPRGLHGCDRCGIKHSPGETQGTSPRETRLRASVWRGPVQMRPGP